MNIAIDYDDTFTAAPEFWRRLIQRARLSHHTVYCVSSRRGTMENVREIADGIGLSGVPVVLCNHNAKHEVVANKGIHIDVWIDDNPWSIVGVDKP